MTFKEKMRLSRPFNQNLVVAAMLFCLPGMYSAITGLGAGGGRPSSLEVANNVNAIIYIFLAFGSIVVGFILHKLTPRICLVIGALGYPLYIGGLWYYDRSGNSWLVYLSGVLSGISGAFLWTTGAYIEFCYPEEKNKAMVSFCSREYALSNEDASTSPFNGLSDPSAQLLALPSLSAPTSTPRLRSESVPVSTSRSY